MSVQQRRHRLAAIVIFAVALIARTSYWWYQGTSLVNDTNGYTAVCSLWATDPIAALFAHKGLLYSGFTIPLCGVLSVPNATFESWIGVQILLSAIGCVIIYRIGTTLVDFRAGLSAGLALALLWDTFNWDVYGLSDSLFTFGMILTLWALSRHYQNPNLQSKIVLLASLGYLVISRPHGFPLVAGWILYDLYGGDNEKRLGLFSNRAIPAAAGGAVIAAIPYVIQRYHLLRTWRSGQIIVNSSTYVYPYMPTLSGESVTGILFDSVHLVIMRF